jgi:hypothetical protein
LALQSFDPGNALIARAARMAGLFEARTRLLAGGSAMAPDRIALLTSDCIGPIRDVSPDETRDWCALVKARAAMEAGRPTEGVAIIGDVRRRQLAADQPRLSAGFGLDFAAEIRSVEVLAQS